MFEQKIGNFLYLDYNTLVYLENLGLTYKQMIPYFAIKVNEIELCRAFKKLGIKHRTNYEKLFESIENSKLSISQLSELYDVSKRTICRIKSKIKKKYYNLQGDEIRLIIIDEAKVLENE